MHLMNLRFCPHINAAINWLKPFPNTRPDFSTYGVFHYKKPNSFNQIPPPHHSLESPSLSKSGPLSLDVYPDIQGQGMWIVYGETLFIPAALPPSLSAFSCFPTPLWEIDETGAAKNRPAGSKSMVQSACGEREKEITKGWGFMSGVSWLFNGAILKSQHYWLIILMKTY